MYDLGEKEKCFAFEADNMMLRTELATSVAAQAGLERESQQLMLQVHSLQCQLHSKTAPHESDMIKKKLVSGQ